MDRKKSPLELRIIYGEASQSKIVLNRFSKI